MIAGLYRKCDWGDHALSRATSLPREANKNLNMTSREMNFRLSHPKINAVALFESLRGGGGSIGIVLTETGNEFCCIYTIL